jgi:hypothetical protein
MLGAFVQMESVCQGRIRNTAAYAQKLSDWRTASHIPASCYARVVWQMHMCSPLHFPYHTLEPLNPPHKPQTPAKVP